MRNLLLCVVLSVSLLMVSRGAAASSEVSGTPLDTLVFTASDTTRAEQITDMLHLYLDPAENPSGQTLFNAGSVSWTHITALAMSPSGTIGGMNLLNASPGVTRLDSDGYVFLHYNGPFWPFPAYGSSQGLLEGWEYDGSSTEGWTVSNMPSTTPEGGTWILSPSAPDPNLISPNISVDAFQSPFIQIELRCTDGVTACAGEFGQVFWQTSQSPGFSESKSKFFSLLDPANIIPYVDIVTYVIPVFENPEWAGTITKLRVDPVLDGQADREIEIGRIVMAYDARMSTSNAKYILAGHASYFSSGDSAHFTGTSFPEGSFFDRARIAMNYIQTELGGLANDFVLVDWPGHDGLPGKTGGQINFGHGIQSSFASDVWPVGHEDAYASIYYYAALRAMAELETEVADHPQWDVPANPFGESAASYDSQADAVKTAIASNFWINGKDRLMACRDINGVVRDIGHVGLNLEAIFFDAVDFEKATDIVDWIAGDRIVGGDDSQGADIYNWIFGPRTTTVDTSDWYVWPMYIWFGMDLSQGNGASWGEQVSNGGGWFWQSFYDLMARIEVRGAADAWARLESILDWYQDTQDSGGFRPYYDTHPGILQGCTSGGGSVGLDCEFIESTLVPMAFLYGFLGYKADVNGLNFAPEVPPSQSFIGAERLHFRKHFYDVTARASVENPFVLQTHPETGVPGFGNSPHTLPLRLENLVPNSEYLVTITDFDTGIPAFLSEVADAEGVLQLSFDMPANGRIELTTSAFLFGDGFETGDTSGWSEAVE